MKGQLFIIDFALALLVATATIAAMIQIYSMAAGAASNLLESDSALSLATLILKGAEPSTTIPYCWSWSNGSSTCTNWSCSTNIRVAKRLSACAQGVCAFEVRTCE